MAPNQKRNTTPLLSAVAKRKLQQRREESQVGVAPNSTGSVGPTTTTEPLEPFPEREHELISAKASEDARQENRLDETKAPTSQPVELSTFKAHRDTLKKTAGNGLILRIREGERLVLLGCYGLRVHRGEISIAGATIRPSPLTHWVHAPRCYSLPVVRCLKSAEVEVSQFSGWPGLRDLERLSPHFRKLWDDPSDQGHSESFRILQSTKDAPRKSKIQLLQSPALWNRKIAELVDACVAASGPIIVCGPKSSGKSTFSRLLSNQLLSRIESRTEARLILAVAFLDVDPGQPEFAQPGHLSLVRVTSPILGPSFCRPLTSHSSGVTVERSHCVASITPGSDPILYMDAVLDLFARYRSSLSECPLIVNTAGWVQDVGLEILVDLITNLEAAEVIYMSENGPEETVQAISGACTSARLTLLPSQETEGSSRTAAEFRAMRTMSYFHAISESAKDEDGALRWNTSPLDNMPPYYASYGGSDRAVLGVVRYGNQVAPEHLTKIINGMVLALVEIERATAFRMGQGKGNTFTKRISELLDSVTETSPEGIPYITVPERYSLDPTYSKSLGLVLVRGIDTKRRLFHILTPISLDVLKNGKPKVLVSGTPGFGLPSWAYTESIERQLYDSGVSGITKGMEIDAPDAATPSSQVDDGDASLLPRLNGTDVEEIPYVEMLRGNDQRDTGRMLRVRRDLGRSS